MMGGHSCSTAAWPWPERVGVAGEAPAETIADELVIATMAIGAGSGCELATKESRFTLHWLLFGGD